MSGQRSPSCTSPDSPGRYDSRAGLPSIAAKHGICSHLLTQRYIYVQETRPARRQKSFRRLMIAVALTAGSTEHKQKIALSAYGGPFFGLVCNILHCLRPCQPVPFFGARRRNAKSQAGGGVDAGETGGEGECFAGIHQLRRTGEIAAYGCHVHSIVQGAERASAGFAHANHAVFSEVKLSCMPTKRTARVLICLHRKRLVALHGFIKKTRATPDDDLKLALTRKRELEQ